MRQLSVIAPALASFVVTATLLLLGSAGQGQTAPARAAPPVVVELFTSQGCSSCPPADAFLEELAKDPGVVAIARPVTYWDRLGWKDTLAREANTSLQRAYAENGEAGAGVYTPQMVVAGKAGVVGSDRSAVNRLIADARKAANAAIAVKGQVIGVAGAGAPADVKIIGLKANWIVRIGSGENGGRVVRYSNIVMSERVIGRWNGGEQAFTLPAQSTSTAGIDRYAIIVQAPNSGVILAGRYL